MQLFLGYINSENNLQLDPAESHHCANVLRHKVDDIIEVIDGKGTLYSAKITSCNPARVILNVLSLQHEYGKRCYFLHIAIAPPKNVARFEWFLEKAVEIGINEITPLLCERSERTNLRHDRLNKIILSAVKQSKKAYLPVLNKQSKFVDFVKQHNNTDKYLASCISEKTSHLLTAASVTNRNLILIGPEGDFTPGETDLAITNGFIPVSLGDTILRTETAGVVAAQIMADRELLIKYRKDLLH